MTEDEMVGWHHQLNGCTNSGRWRRTAKPGVLQSMGSQRIGHNLATEQQMQCLPPSLEHFYHFKKKQRIPKPI